MLIPSPWSGDDNDPTDWRYHAWFVLYRRTRQIRHAFGLHDWYEIPIANSRRCSWCGARPHSWVPVGQADIAPPSGGFNQP